MNRHASTFLLVALCGTVLFNYGAPTPDNAPPANSAPQVQRSSPPVESIPAPCPVGDNLECAAHCSGFCPSDDLKSTISGFFGSKTLEGSATDRDPLGVPPGVDRRALQFVIVTVPDPVHTRLSLFFDESIDAVGQAATDDGYLFARASLPWDNAQHAEPSNFATRLREEAYQQAKEEIPGLMIFRKAREDGVQNSLLVFLVGELPTEGINKRQFHNALRAIQAISGIAPPAVPPTINCGFTNSQPAAQDIPPNPNGVKSGFWLGIVGPTFSGSLYSLSEIFECDETANSFLRRVKVFSGTVRDKSTIDWFRGRHEDLALHAFHEHDSEAMQAFEQYVCRLHYDPGSVAELSEDETAYGGESLARDDADHGRSAGACPGKIRKLFFPRDIASLRAAYERELRRQEAVETQGRRSRRTSLRLSLEDTGSDDDSVATYSRSQTPLVEDEVMKAIVSKLRADHIHFIVLRATSTLDLLFLSRYLQSAYPQGRIVAAVADRLFDAGGTPMRGMLAFASPSLWIGQAASDFSPKPALEPGEEAASTVTADVYTAMRQALTFERTSLSTAPGGGIKSGQSLDPPEPDSSQAALWLTVLGRDGLWPLARLGTEPRSAGSFKIYATLSWVMLYFGALLLATVYLVLAWLGSIRARTGAMVAFAPVKDATRSWLLCILAWLVLLTLLVIFVPVMLPGGVPGGVGAALEAGAFTMLALLLAFTFLDLKRREPDPKGPRFMQASFWFPVISAALIVVYFVCGWAFLRDGPPGNVFLYRYLHLSSGVSPLVPWLLLLGAALWWAWYGLKGMVLLDGRRPRLPDENTVPTDDTVAYVRFRTLRDDTNQRLLAVARPMTWDAWVYIPALAGAVIIYLVLVSQSSSHLLQIHGLERRPLDLAYQVGLGLVLFVLASTLTQMALTWVATRNLLRGLDRLPLRRAFNGLKEFSWHPIWQLSAGGENDLNAIFMREIESLSHLRNTSVLKHECPPTFAESIEASHMRLECLLKTFRTPAAIRQNQSPRPDAGAPIRTSRRGGESGRRGHQWLNGRFAMARDESKQISSFEALRKKLAATCGEGLKFLQEIWDSESGPVLCDQPGSDVLEQEVEGIPSHVKAAEQFVCLVYVNFIFMGLRQIRNFLTIVAGMFVFVALSLSSYPFEPKATLRSFMLLLFLALGAAAAIVYAQMHRDSILSRITGTSPGKLGGDFWLRLGSAVGLPLLGLLAYQFPQISSLMFWWLEPALQALK